MPRGPENLFGIVQTADAGWKRECHAWLHARTFHHLRKAREAVGAEMTLEVFFRAPGLSVMKDRSLAHLA